MAGRVPVQHVESGKIFASIREAARYFGINEERINGKSCFLPGYTFKKAHVDTASLRIPYTSEPELWRPIPEYEGLYSISNKGRIRSDKFINRFKKYSTNKQGQHVVILSKNSCPKCCTVESLWNLTWIDRPVPESNFDVTKKYKPVKCVDDNMVFDSRKACCSYYGIDYGKFLKAIRAAKQNNSQTFSCKSKNFKLI